MTKQKPKDQLTELLGELKGQRRKAAEYILARPGEVAVYSLRKVAARALVSTGTLVSLAHDLGYPTYNALRAKFQHAETGVLDYFSSSAQALQSRGSSDPDDLIEQTMRADLDNISRALGEEPMRAIKDAARVMLRSRRIYIIGRRASFGLMHYLYYMTQLVRDEVVFLDGSGDMNGDGLAGLTDQDVVLCCGFYPYIRSVVDTLDKADERGASIISITDSAASPLAQKARSLILFSVESPGMFASITAAVVIAQALVAQLTALGGEPIFERLKQREKLLSDLNVFAL